MMVKSGSMICLFVLYPDTNVSITNVCSVGVKKGIMYSWAMNPLTNVKYPPSGTAHDGNPALWKFPVQLSDICNMSKYLTCVFFCIMPQ